MEHDHYQWVNPLFQWPFSMSLFVCLPGRVDGFVMVCLKIVCPQIRCFINIVIIPINNIAILKGCRAKTWTLKLPFTC